MLFSDIQDVSLPKLLIVVIPHAFHLKTMMSKQDLLIVGVIEGIEIMSVNWCETAAIRMKGK